MLYGRLSTVQSVWVPSRIWTLISEILREHVLFQGGVLRLGEGLSRKNGFYPVASSVAGLGEQQRPHNSVNFQEV